MFSVIENIASFSSNGKVLASVNNKIKKIGEKNMSNCNCVIRATSVALKNGTYTVTVPTDSVTNLCACELIEVGLFASIPTDSTCNLVEITDGTTTLQVYKVESCCNGGCIADLWRTTLACRSILCLKYAPSSGSLTINGVKGKRGCV